VTIWQQLLVKSILCGS